MTLDESIPQHSQRAMSLALPVNFVHMMKSCDGEYWFAGISADDVFATSVHGPDNPHMRCDELHLNALRRVELAEVKKDADSENSKFCIALCLRIDACASTIQLHQWGEGFAVAEFMKCKIYDLVLGEGAARRVSS